MVAILRQPQCDQARLLWLIVSWFKIQDSNAFIHPNYMIVNMDWYIGIAIKIIAESYICLLFICYGDPYWGIKPPL